jgi:hypothetical protein
MHAGLTFGQFDFSSQALRFRLLGNGHFQNAFLELCLGVVGVDPLWQGDGTLEVTVVTLRVIIVAIFLFLLDLLLTFDSKHISGHRDLDILLIEAGQLGGNPHLFAGFADIDSRQEFFGNVAPQIGG